jgi:hypothetical protein
MSPHIRTASTFRLIGPYITQLLVLMFCATSFCQTPEFVRRPTILILGTYHLGDDREDSTSPKRQKEIGELVTRLTRFKPTKIALEARFDNAAQFNKLYEQYLAGKHELGRNETEQIGFRLAKTLKHSLVYPIDWRNNFDLSPVIAFAAANNQGAIVQKGLGRVTEIDRKIGELIKTATVLEILRFLNDDKMRRAVDNAMLTTLVHVGKGDNYVGTDVVAGWYERNLKIFTNVTRIIESDVDRILVIIGSGHANLLRRFVQDHDGYELEDVGKYLSH